MKFKLDENLPAALVNMLRSAGHDAQTVSEESLSGAEDPRILRAAASERRLLMTFDLDFADIRRYPLGSHAGIIVFRLNDQRWAALKEPVRRLIDSGILDRVQGGLAIVDELRVRIRARPAIL